MPGYRGRFAPSPTGPLHFGSLVAAVASYLDARAHAGEWLVRIEDVDAARCSRQWADDILRSLEAFGFTWDGEVWYQTSAARRLAYADALRMLEERGLVYPCACSRKEIEDSQLRPDSPAEAAERRYPGTCRNGLREGKAPRAWRVRVNRDPIEFHDRSYGCHSEVLEDTAGDFILKRADGPFAYQLAVVVDDAQQGITDVVRGADLLSSTARQIYLQRLLGYPQTRYWHIPVVTNDSGEKLSKQTGARPLDLQTAPALLGDAFRFLGLAPPPQLRNAPLAELWVWASDAFSQSIAGREARPWLLA